MNIPEGQAPELSEKHLEIFKQRASTYLNKLEVLRDGFYRNHPEGQYFDYNSFEPEYYKVFNKTPNAKIFDELQKPEVGPNWKRFLPLDEAISKEFSKPNHGLVGDYFVLERLRIESEQKSIEEASRNNLKEVLTNWRAGGLINTSIRVGAIASNNLSNEAESWSRGGAVKSIASVAVPVAVGAAIAGPIGAVGVLAVMGVAKLNGGENSFGHTCASVAAMALSLTAKALEVSFIGIEKTIDFASRLAKRRSEAGGAVIHKVSEEAKVKSVPFLPK